MASVDPLFAQWLQSEGLWQLSEDAALRARWGDTALTTSRMTTTATKADAAAEGLRQLAFLGPVCAIDEHMLLGEWRDRRGQVVTLKIAQLGYDAGVDVMVLGALDDRATGLSRVTVLRRL
ncbi:MAG: hypothetical protein ABL914_12285 [Novosphingobium sp.]|uniref:hypothetical protein n=1 Tax=Novosphingobium sp. TaxID=1874826 RepID=UPI0032BF12D1